MGSSNCSVCGDGLISGSMIEEKDICMDCLLKEQKAISKLGIGDLSHVPGVFTLTNSQRRLLISVYKRHLLTMGTVQRHRFMPEHLKKVEWDPKDETVNVYFSNIWWHYTNDHEWY